MIGYVIFVLLLFLSRTIKSKQKQLLFMFVVITLFSGLRYGIGYDYYSYLDEVMGYKSNESTELIPRLMEDWSGKVYPYLFFLITSIFTSVFYYISIRKGGSDYYLETIFYVTFPFLFMNQLGIIRQGMATAIIFCAIVIYQDSLYKRVLLFVLAFLCHQSSVICLLIFVPWYRIRIKQLWALLLIGFVGSIVLLPLVEALVVTGFLGEVATDKALRYLDEEGLSEGQIMKYLIYIIAISLLVFYDRLVLYKKENAYYIGLITIGVAIFSLFSFNATLSKRFCMFFFTPAIFVIPQLFKVLRISKEIYLFICLVLFILTVYIGSNNIRIEDRNGSSVTYPYRTYIDI